MEQGGVFRLILFVGLRLPLNCLNPFGTGRGLSTANRIPLPLVYRVSIPLEQGGVSKNLNYRKCLIMLLYIRICKQKAYLNRYGKWQDLSYLWCICYSRRNLIKKIALAYLLGQFFASSSLSKLIQRYLVLQIKYSQAQIQLFLHFYF